MWPVTVAKLWVVLGCFSVFAIADRRVWPSLTNLTHKHRCCKAIDAMSNTTHAHQNSTQQRMPDLTPEHLLTRNRALGSCKSSVSKLIFRTYSTLPDSCIWG
jgi:hypothetical protein